MDGDTAKFIVEQINLLRRELKDEIRALGDRLAPVERSFWKSAGLIGAMIILWEVGFKVFEVVAK